MSINMEGLLADFVSETNELLDRAESSFLELEQGFNRELVDGIFRAVHTIKGNSGLFDLEKISHLSHALENVLNIMREGSLEPTLDIIDLGLTSIDRLRLMMKNLSQSADHEIDDLVKKLDKIAGSGGGATVVAAPAAPAAEVASPDVAATSSVANGSKSSAKANGNGERAGRRSLRIPGRYLREAKSSGKNLALIYLDATTQGAHTLTALLQKLAPLIDSGVIVESGPLLDQQTTLSESGSTLPWFLLFFGVQPPEQSLRLYGLTAEKIRHLHRNGQVASEEPDLLIDAEPQTISVATAPSESSLSSAQDSGQLALTPENSGRDDLPTHTEQSLSEQGTKEPAARGQATLSTGGETHLKVPVKLIDSLINLAGETVIARNELVQKITLTGEPSLDIVGKRISYLITRLQEGIMRTRLQELQSVFQRLPRLVRDVAQTTGKKVDLVLEGGEVELDKTLIDAIGDSMMHMIKNAIDHGLESPDERLRRGKKETGQVRVAAQLRGGNVVLTIRDDGRGLNLEKIRAKAISSGVISKEAAATMSPDDIADLVFEPGLSTAEKVTQTSGRGVGMDVVRSNFKKLGGSVDITTESGRGTTITATLPQTLTIVTCLLIKSANTLFALPQQNMVELILVDPKQVSEVEHHPVYNLRGHLLPLLNLANVMKLPGAKSNGSLYIAVVRSERHHFGLLIDQIVNMEEIVVKRLGEHFAGLTFFSGAAIMGDGEAVLILDVPGLAKFANLQVNMHESDDESDELDGDDDSSGYLLFNLAEQRFAVPVVTVPRIEKVEPDQLEIFMGLEVIQYRDEVVPIVRLEQFYDINLKYDNSEIYVIIFNVNGVRTGIVATEVYNVVNDLPDLDRSKFFGRSVLGHTILNGVTTICLDIGDLLTHLQETQFRELAQHLKKSRSGDGFTAEHDEVAK